VELPVASRVAILKRVGAIVGTDRYIPSQWDQYSITEQLVIEERDPQVAAALKGQLSAELEMELLTGKFSEVAPVIKSEAQLRQEAVDSWLEAHPVPDPADTDRMVRERQMAAQASLQESALIANAQLANANRSARGW
jgi:hypothetical protein